jgi:hypothetical protein
MLISGVKQFNQSFRRFQLHLTTLLHGLASGFSEFRFQVSHVNLETRDIMENADVLITSRQDES